MSITQGKSKALQPTERDIQMMLACECHLGTKNVEKDMMSYVYGRRSDGIHILNLKKTWEKLVLAARIIVAIENPNDICAISSRQYGQRAVLKFAKHTNSQYIAGRFTPGTFTNQIQSKFMEPRLLIVTDPRADHQPIKEASYANIPVIALCDADSPLSYVDVAIPCNNKGKESIGLMFWLLAREVLRMSPKSPVSRRKKWDVCIDLFFYRDPEQIQKQEEAEEEAEAEESNMIVSQDWQAIATNENEEWYGDEETTDAFMEG